MVRVREYESKLLFNSEIITRRDPLDDILMSLGFYTGKVIFMLFIIWSLLLFLEFIFCLSLADIGTWKMATKVDHNPEWQEPEATEDWDNGINFGTL